MERIYLTADATLTGSDEADELTIFNSDGSSRLYGRGGDDKLSAFNLADTVDSGAASPGPRPAGAPAVSRLASASAARVSASRSRRAQRSERCPPLVRSPAALPVAPAAGGRAPS